MGCDSVGAADEQHFCCIDVDRIPKHRFRRAYSKGTTLAGAQVTRACSSTTEGLTIAMCRFSFLLSILVTSCCLYRSACAGIVTLDSGPASGALCCIGNQEIREHLEKYSLLQSRAL